MIIRNEGGDESAKIAGLNYVMRCVDMYKKGFTFRGVPFVSFNSWTLRYEYLYIKKQFRNALLSQWTRTSTETVKQPSKSQSSAEAPKEVSMEETPAHAQKTEKPPRPRPAPKPSSEEADAKKLLKQKS